MASRRCSYPLPAALAILLACAQPLEAAPAKLTFDCDNDTVTLQDGKVHGGEEGNLTITALTREDVKYDLVVEDNPKALAMTQKFEKVDSLCFGHRPNALDQALIAFSAGNDATAAAAFEQAAAERGPSAFWVVQVSLFHAGQCWMNTGSFDKAAAAFDQLQKAHPNGFYAGDVLLLQVRIKAGKGDVQGAIDLIVTILKDSNLPPKSRYDLLMLKGKLHSQLKQWPPATEAYKEANRVAGQLGDDADRAKTRCTLELARVKLGQGDLAAARADTTGVLRGSKFGEPGSNEARALAYSVEGDCFLAESELSAGDPAKVKTLLEQALDRYLKVVAIYGEDDEVDAQIRGEAFQRIDYLAGPGRLSLRDVQAGAAGKARHAGF